MGFFFFTPYVSACADVMNRFWKCKTKNVLYFPNPSLQGKKNVKRLLTRNIQMLPLSLGVAVTSGKVSIGIGMEMGGVRDIVHIIYRALPLFEDFSFYQFLPMSFKVWYILKCAILYQGPYLSCSAFCLPNLAQWVTWQVLWKYLLFEWLCMVRMTDRIGFSFGKKKKKRKIQGNWGSDAIIICEEE